MQSRTTKIIIAILLFVIGIPVFFFWILLDSCGNNRYWKISNASIAMIQKDSLATEHYHSIGPRSGLDTSKLNKLIVYLDVDYYDNLRSSGEGLNARPAYGYMGNPQKFKTFKVLYSLLHKNEYKDVTNCLLNDINNSNVRRNGDNLREQNFFIYEYGQGSNTHNEEMAYLFDNVDQFLQTFNENNVGFMVGYKHGYRCVTFKIDKNIFTDKLFKLKLIIEFNDNNSFSRTYYGRLK